MRDLEKFGFYGLSRLVNGQPIQIVVHCAAYNWVYEAIDYFKFEQSVYSISIHLLQTVSSSLVPLIVDYGFYRADHVPFEDDAEKPIGVYGTSILNGKRKIQNTDSSAIIKRTSWLCFSFRNDFLKTILSLGVEKSCLNIRFDLNGTPTYEADLAKDCEAIVSDRIYLNTNRIISNCSKEGVASCCFFAILAISRPSCDILAMESKDHKIPAKWPAFPVLSKGKTKNDLRLNIP